MIAGLPLIAHTIGHALASGLFDAVAVSSDAADILDAASGAGATLVIRRPDELATDQAGKIPAITHAVRAAEETLGTRFDTLVDLDATSPLRAIEDIVGAVRLFEESGAISVITGAPARRSPYFNLVEMDPIGHVALVKHANPPILRRQDAPHCFDMNASIYVWRRDEFLLDPRVFYDNTCIFVMPEERSIDIDSPLDWEIVRFLMERGQ